MSCGPVCPGRDFEIAVVSVLLSAMIVDEAPLSLRFSVGGDSCWFGVTDRRDLRKQFPKQLFNFFGSSACGVAHIPDEGRLPRCICVSLPERDRSFGDFQPEPRGGFPHVTRLP